MELAFTGKFIRDGKDVYLLDSIIHIPSDNLDLKSFYIQILVELIDDINKDVQDKSIASKGEYKLVNLIHGNTILVGTKEECVKKQNACYDVSLQVSPTSIFKNVSPKP